MTPTPDLEALRKLSEKATPGPWATPRLPSHVSGCRDIKGNRAGTHRQAQYRTAIASTHGLSNDETDRANAELIVAAVNYVRALLASEPQPPETGLREALDEERLQTAIDYALSIKEHEIDGQRFSAKHRAVPAIARDAVDFYAGRQGYAASQPTDRSAPDHGPDGNEGYCRCGAFVGHGGDWSAHVPQWLSPTDRSAEG